MAKTRTVTQTFTSDWNGDGVPDSTTWTTSTFENDNLVREETLFDYSGGDGIPDQATLMEAEFDRKGNMTAQTWARDYDANGTTDSTDEWTWTFDRKGNQIQLTLASDYDGDGVIDSSYTQDTTFNKAGNVLTDVFTYSWGRTDTTWFEYNRAGDPTAKYTDYGTDGIVEETTIYEYPVA